MSKGKTTMITGSNQPENPRTLMGFKSRITAITGLTVDSNSLMEGVIDSLCPTPQDNSESKVTGEPAGDIEQVVYALDKLERESRNLREQVDTLRGLLGVE